MILGYIVLVVSSLNLYTRTYCSSSFDEDPIDYSKVSNGLIYISLEEFESWEQNYEQRKAFFMNKIICEENLIAMDLIDKERDDGLKEEMIDFMITKKVENTKIQDMSLNRLDLELERDDISLDKKVDLIWRKSELLAPISANESAEIILETIEILKTNGLGKKLPKSTLEQLMTLRVSDELSLKITHALAVDLIDHVENENDIETALMLANPQIRNLTETTKLEILLAHDDLDPVAPLTLEEKCDKAYASYMFNKNSDRIVAAKFLKLAYSNGNNPNGADPPSDISFIFEELLFESLGQNDETVNTVFGLIDDLSEIIWNKEPYEHYLKATLDTITSRSLIQLKENLTLPLEEKLRTHIFQNILNRLTLPVPKNATFLYQNLSIENLKELKLVGREEQIYQLYVNICNEYPDMEYVAGMMKTLIYNDLKIIQYINQIKNERIILVLEYLLIKEYGIREDVGDDSEIEVGEGFTKFIETFEIIEEDQVLEAWNKQLISAIFGLTKDLSLNVKDQIIRFESLLQGGKDEDTSQMVRYKRLQSLFSHINGKLGLKIFEILRGHINSTLLLNSFIDGMANNCGDEDCDAPEAFLSPWGLIAKSIGSIGDIEIIIYVLKALYDASPKYVQKVFLKILPAKIPLIIEYTIENHQNPKIALIYKEIFTIMCAQENDGIISKYLKNLDIETIYEIDNSETGINNHLDSEFPKMEWMQIFVNAIDRQKKVEGKSYTNTIARYLMKHPPSTPLNFPTIPPTKQIFHKIVAEIIERDYIDLATAFSVSFFSSPGGKPNDARITANEFKNEIKTFTEMLQTPYQFEVAMPILQFVPDLKNISEWQILVQTLQKDNDLVMGGNQLDDKSIGKDRKYCNLTELEKRTFIFKIVQFLTIPKNNYNDLNGESISNDKLYALGCLRLNDLQYIKDKNEIDYSWVIYNYLNTYWKVMASKNPDEFIQKLTQFPCQDGKNRGLSIFWAIIATQSNLSPFKILNATIKALSFNRPSYLNAKNITALLSYLPGKSRKRLLNALALERTQFKVRENPTDFSKVHDKTLKIEGINLAGKATKLDKKVFDTIESLTASTIWRNLDFDEFVDLETERKGKVKRALSGAIKTIFGQLKDLRENPIIEYFYDQLEILYVQGKVWNWCDKIGVDDILKLGHMKDFSSECLQKIGRETFDSLIRFNPRYISTIRAPINGQILNAIDKSAWKYLAVEVWQEIWSNNSILSPQHPYHVIMNEDIADIRDIADFLSDEAFIIDPSKWVVIFDPVTGIQRPRKIQISSMNGMTNDEQFTKNTIARMTFDSLLSGLQLMEGTPIKLQNTKLWKYFAIEHDTKFIRGDLRAQLIRMVDGIENSPLFWIYPAIGVDGKIIDAKDEYVDEHGVIHLKEKEKEKEKQNLHPVLPSNGGFVSLGNHDGINSLNEKENADNDKNEEDSIYYHHLNAVATASKKLGKNSKKSSIINAMSVCAVFISIIMLGTVCIQFLKK